MASTSGDGVFICLDDCFTKPLYQYCWFCLSWLHRHIPHSTRLAMHSKITNREYWNRDQWLAGLIVCTAEQSGHRHLFTHTFFSYPAKLRIT